MYYKKYTLAIRLTALLLTLILVAAPVSTQAATVEPVLPCASDYLSFYDAYIYPVANAKIQVWFSMTGKGFLDTIGVLSIQIYHSTDNATWTWYKTFSHTDYPQLLSYNDNNHSGYVECQGAPGKYYKATVTFYGSSNGGGESRHYYTDSQKAVLNPS